MYLVFWLVLGYVAIHLAFFAGAQRATFGDNAGNMLAVVEVATIVSIGFVGWMWSRKKEQGALALVFTIAAALLAFAGWFVQPEQRYERALAREFQCEADLYNYTLEQENSPDSPEKRSLHLRRIKEELAARKLELQAAKVRFNGEPLYFRSNFISWMLWIDSLICVAGAIFVFRLPINAQMKENIP